MQMPEDPIKPMITFDSYVIPKPVPQPVQRQQPPTPPQANPVTHDFQLTGMMAAVSTIAFLTFVLGIMATLKFTNPTDFAGRTETAPTQDIAVVVPLEQATPAPLMAEEDAVTRQDTSDLISPVVAPVKEPEPDTNSVVALQQAVLKGLQPAPTVNALTDEEKTRRAIKAQTEINQRNLHMLREGVLAGTYSVKARDENGIKRLVLTTDNAEMDRASIGRLLLDAAKNGEIGIPAALSTADGELDMDTLLFNLVQTSLMNDGTDEGEEAAHEMSRRAYAASDAKIQHVQGKRVYVVERGDSLAYISLQFYGRPNAYKRIFEANREQLSSPDLIRVGQRLIIPG